MRTMSGICYDLGAREGPILGAEDPQVQSDRGNFLSCLVSNVFKVTLKYEIKTVQKSK